MSSPSPCVICDGVAPWVAIDRGETEKGREALVKFFRFLERHLAGDDVDKEGQGGRKREGLSFDIVLAAEVPLLACDNCLQIVESFSQLYEQMKSVELRLNRKLETLKNLMCFDGQRDSKMDEVQGSVQQLGIKRGRRLGRGKGEQGNEGVPNIVVYFKTRLVKKCKKKLKATFPKLILTKNNIPSDRNRNATIDQAKIICRTPITNLETELTIASSDKDGYTPVLDTSESPKPITPKTPLNRSIHFREGMVKKCEEQFERDFPKVVITKLSVPAPPHENKNARRNPDAASTISGIAVTGLDLELFTASVDHDQEGHTRTPSPFHEISELSEYDPAVSQVQSPVEEDETLIGSVNPEFLLALHGNYEENLPMDWDDDDDTSADLPDIFPLEVKLEIDEGIESSIHIENAELSTRPSITENAKAAALSGSESDASEYSSESESESEDSDHNDDKKKKMQARERAKQKQYQLKYKAIRAQKRASRLKLGTGIPCNVPGCPERLFTPQSKEESEDHAKLHGNFPCSFCELVHNYAPDLAWHEFLKHSKDFTKEKIEENIIRSCPRGNCLYKSQYKEKCIRHHLTSHLKLVANGPPNTCTICKLVLSEREVLRLHYFSHHDLSKTDNPNDAHKCDQKDCPAYFLKERQLQIHKRRNHSVNARFSCEIVSCNRSFSTRLALKSHELKRHGASSDALRCTFPDCNRGFKTEGHLAQHFKMVHQKLSLDKGNDRTIAYTSKERRGNGPPPTKLVEIPCTVPDCPERLFTPRSTKESENHSRLHGNFPCSFCDLAHTYAPVHAWHEFLKHSPNSSEEECQENVARSCPRPNCSFQHENKSECINHHLTSHMNLIANGPANTCNICKFVVLSNQNIDKVLEHHHRTNHDLNSEDNQNDANKCDQKDCPAYFLTARQLTIHKLRNHLIQAPCICKIEGCKKRFASRTGLHLHKRRKHGIIGDHRCTFPGCDRVFENEHNLAIHFTVAHKKTKIPIKCPKCDESCLTLTVLKSHIKTHSLDPNSPEQFMCTLCGKNFKGKMSLERHQRSHSTSELKKRQTQQKLDSYIKTTHSKRSAQFHCKICGKGFIYRLALWTHMNKIHPDQREDEEDVQNELRKTSLT